MLFRSWLTFAIVIAIVQAALASLSVLQHDAIFSDLLRKRMLVMAQTVAASFQPFVNIGLPLSLARNGAELVARPLTIDSQIQAVYAVNPSGIIVHTTLDPRPRSIPRDVLRAMQLSDEIKWSLESSDQVYSGFNLKRGDTVVGAIIVAYPTERLAASSRAIKSATLKSALLIWFAFSALALLCLRLLLAAPERAVSELGALSPVEPAGDNARSAEPLPPANRSRIFGAAIERLSADLASAERQYLDAERSLSAFAAKDPPEESLASEPAAVVPSRQDPPISSSNPRSLARQVAGRLAPAAAAFIAISAVILGGLILRQVNESIAPELAGRTNLIGTIVSDNVQRAVGAGVPLSNLVGAETYFGDMLDQLPEVAYVAVATGGIVLEAGERIDPYLAPPRERKGVRSHPIIYEGEEIAYVVIDIDPAFITKRFRDVFLDISVVVFVTVLLAFEITLLLTSRSMTAALDRLQRLAAFQAAGDFSKRVSFTARGAIDRVAEGLVERADRLRSLYAEAVQATSGQHPTVADLETTGSRYRLNLSQTQTLRFSYFTDIRLALFLFAAADELPLSFLPIYTRAAGNPLPWLDESVVISLPLAGYLVAILFATPYSRTLAERVGRQRLMLIAAAPTLLAHVGLYFATTVAEIVLWRTVTGFGYALVTLACQDYVIDTAPPGERDRSLGMYSTVLFAGVFCGTALGGVLADRFGQANVFLLSAALIGISAILVFSFVPPAAPPQSADRGRFPAIMPVLRNRPFAALVFGIAIPMNVVLQAFISYLVALTLDSLGSSVADIGRTLMLYFIGIAAVGSLSGRLADIRISPPVAALSGQLIASVSLVPIVFWPDQVTMVVAVLGAGIGHGFIRTAQISVAIDLCESDEATLDQTSALVAMRTLERGGSILGLLAIAAVAGFLGYIGAIAVVAVWSMIGALLFLPFVARSAFAQKAWDSRPNHTA